MNQRDLISVGIDSHKYGQCILSGKKWLDAEEKYIEAYEIVSRKAKFRGPGKNKCNVIIPFK